MKVILSRGDRRQKALGQERASCVQEQKGGWVASTEASKWERAGLKAEESLGASQPTVGRLGSF